MVNNFISVFGINSTIAVLGKSLTDKNRNIDNEIHRQGFKLEAEIKNSIAGRRAEPTSVDTGKFLNSVNTDNKAKFTSIVKSELDYSKYLEDGTSKIKARKHFSNSLDRRKRPINLALKRVT